MDVSTILVGIGAGVTYSLTSYFKKKEQEFEWNKFLITVGIGAVSGIGMKLFNLPIETMQEYLITLGIVPVLENVIKIIYRKFFKK